MKELQQKIAQALMDDALHLEIRNAGIFRFSNNYKFETHNHRETEIIYVRSGHCSVGIKEKVITLRKGDCLLIHRDIPHWFMVNEQESCQISQLEFCATIPEYLRSELSVFQGRYYCKLMRCEYVNELLESISRMHCVSQKDKTIPLLLQLMLLQLLIALSSPIDQQEIFRENSLVHRILKYIHSNYEYDMKVEDLAATFKVSSRYIRECFQKELGLSCRQYITSLRIEKAKELLWFSRKSVTEIAADTGFNTSQYFCRVFQQYTGKTPVEYRNLWKGKQGYEHVPVEFELCPHLKKLCKEKLHADDYQEYFGFPWREVEDLRLKDHDVEKYRKFYQKPLAEGADIDIWGVGHEKSPNSMHMTYMRHPLEDMEDLEELEAYPFPDFASADGSHQAEQVRKIKEQDLIALGNMQMTIWECAWYMRSMEELFCDMMMEDEKAEFLLDKVTEFSMIRALSYAKAGVDVLFLGDDIGMQHTIMMSEELYVTWIKPRLKKIIDAVKEVNPDIIVFYHSCGFIEPLIPHLIEAGIDVLNPIQSECMDFEEIYRKYGDKISFHGTIGTQTVMPKGTPEEVKEVVWHNLDIAGEKGGLFVAPTHMLEPEVPLENILAYVEACRTYKKK